MPDLVLSATSASQPGPGQYQLPSTRDARACTLGARLEAEPGKKNASPGPAYDPSHRFSSPRKRDPAFSFGTGARPGEPMKAVPGPGAYDGDFNKSGRAQTAPAYTLGSRAGWDKDPVSITAGPGSPSKDPQFGPRSGFSFGHRSDKDAMVKDDVVLLATSAAQGPGPGNYDSKCAAPRSHHAQPQQAPKRGRGHGASLHRSQGLHRR